MATKTPAFEKAIAESNKLKSKPNQDELLEVGTRPTPPFLHLLLHLPPTPVKTARLMTDELPPSGPIAIRSLQARESKPALQSRQQTGGIQFQGGFTISYRPDPEPRRTAAITRTPRPHRHTDPATPLCPSPDWR